MYDIIIKDDLIKRLKDIKIKDKKSLDNIENKMQDVAITLEFAPNHFKNLKKPLQKYKRVHVNKSFVLIFSTNNLKKEVTFVDYEHHKNVYKKIYV